MPVNPDFYNVIASVAREDGHAYRGHVLGDKPKDAFYGVSEFNNSDGSFGNEISIKSGSDLANFILDTVNSPTTKGFYNTKNNSVTLVNYEDNVFILFNNSPKYGDAGTIFRPFNDSKNHMQSLSIIANKYREKLSGARLMKEEGVVIEGRGPEDLRAFVQMFAEKTDFSAKPSAPVIKAQRLNNEVVTNSHRRSTLDLMADNRDIVVSLKGSDLTNAEITDPPEAEVPRIKEIIRRAEAKIVAERDALAEKHRKAGPEHSRAKQINDKILCAVKQGAEITDMGDGTIFVSTKVEGEHIDYQIKMAADGKTAELQDDTTGQKATLTTASRLDALKNHVTKQSPLLLKNAGWETKVNGKPLHWVRKMGVASVLTLITSLGVGVTGQTPNAMYSAYDKMEPQSLNFNYVSHSTDKDTGVYDIPISTGDVADDKTLASLAGLVDVSGLDESDVSLSYLDTSDPDITNELII